MCLEYEPKFVAIDAGFRQSLKAGGHPNDRMQLRQNDMLAFELSRAKVVLHARGNTVYGFMILFGWAATPLVAANTTVGGSLGQAPIDGQLYFAANIELSAAVVLAVVSTVARPVLEFPKGKEEDPGGKPDQ